MTPRPRASIVVASLLLAAACGGSDEASSPTTDGQSPSTTATESADEASPANDAATADDATTESFEIPVFGGATFMGPAGARLEAPGDLRVVVNERDDGPPDVIFIARVSQTPTGQAVTNAADAIALIEGANGAEVTAGDEPLEAFGRELDQYIVTGADDTLTFSIAPFGQPSPEGWSPDPYAYLYMADLGDSVMVVTAMGPDETIRDSNDVWLRELAPTMELLTDDGEPAPLETADDVIELDLGEAIIIEPTEEIAGIDTFREFQPIDAGVYQVPNLGAPITVEVPEQWAVQPNFPGFVVLTDVDSPGPYIDDIRMIVGSQLLVPTNDSRLPIGEGVEIADIDSILDSPPVNLAFTNVDRSAEVAGLPAVSFDASIIDTSQCSAGSPCSYSIVGSGVESTDITTTFAHRFWVVPDFPSGPLVLAIGAEPDAADAWFDRTDALIETIEAG